MFYHIRKLFRQQVKLIYRPEYFLGFRVHGNFRVIDPQRFRKIRKKLINEGLAQFREFITPPMILDEQLALVHDPKYLAKIKDPVSLGRELGIAQIDPWDDQFIEFYKAVTGGTVFGFQQALREPQKPVFNFGGGFHHAQYDKAEGYCLLNDTVLAIRCARRKIPDVKVLIVDLDYHQGNGNLILLKDDPLSYTFSMHALSWVEVQKKEKMEIILPPKCGDSDYLNPLKNTLPGCFDSFKPDAVIYIAGSDPYGEDTLCDFEVSEEGLLERDLFVYNLALERKLPLLVLPAGGYGPESWRPYYNFIRSIIMKKNG